MRNTVKGFTEESTLTFDTDLARDGISLTQRTTVCKFKCPIKYMHMATEMNAQITVILYQYLKNRPIQKTFICYQALNLLEYL